MATQTENLNGIIRCTRYAFMPNRLHLCGPENQADILEFYANTNQQKNIKPIEPLLKEFQTMFPYLRLITNSNRQKNPFAEKIIEAYWLGNNYLNNVKTAELYRHIADTIKLDKKISRKEFSEFQEKFNQFALPHHNFHVFSVWRRTGNIGQKHTLATMDACRISWGKIIRIKPQSLVVKTKPLIADANGKIKESAEFIEREILNYFEGNILLDSLKAGDYVSLHWGCVCEKLTKQQVARLQKYTDLSLQFAANL
jgi:hypothetical protein